MTLGLIMYFYYGITHSTLENPSEEIELTVDQSYLQKPPANNDHHQTTAVWDRHGFETKLNTGMNGSSTNEIEKNIFRVRNCSTAFLKIVSAFM